MKKEHQPEIKMKLGLKPCFAGAVFVAASFAMPSQAQQSPSAPSADSYGWLGTETVKTKFGEFEFRNGYPTPAAADALLDQLKLNRGIEVYLTQIPPVAVVAEHRGMAEFGAKRPNQLIIWEQLMDAATVLLTANTETVYALGHLDLKADGPTVLEAPPKMLGLAMDALQRYLVDIGIPGPDKGQGANTSSCRRVTRVRCRTVISCSSRQPSRSVSACAASRSMARPIRRSRS
jgi:uncharacterized protein DUF1254